MTAFIRCAGCQVIGVPPTFVIAYPVRVTEVSMTTSEGDLCGACTSERKRLRNITETDDDA